MLSDVDLSRAVSHALRHEPWLYELELDETQYDWGTLYELECETEEPDALKPKLEGLLRAHGVAFKYSTTSKFANFRNRTLE